MRMGVFIVETTAEKTTVDEVVANAKAAEAAGFATAWVPHIPWSLDAFTALTLAASVTDRIELATGVVPTYPRHPMSMAQAAMSTQAVAGGRVTLGIGPSHPVVIENMYGISYERPAAHTADYVRALQACFATGPDNNIVSYQGEFYKFAAMLDVPGSADVPVLVAALAPKMLQLTGELAQGTVTFWADEHTVEDHVVPRINKAAADVGRPAPRIVVGMPVAVVDDVDDARRRGAAMFSNYESIPTYRRVLDRNTTPNPVDAALIGDEKTVRARLQRFADVGATDFMASALGLGSDRTKSRDLTLEVLKEFT